MKLKHLILTTVIFLIAIVIVNSQPVKTNGNLSVKGTNLVNEKGEQIVLRGVSYGWHNWWPRFYNKESVKWLTDDWKCTVVRAAMGVGPQGSYIDKKEWSKEKMEAVIKKIRPMLQADGGDVELVDVSDGIVKVRLTGACKGCPMSQMTLKNGIERLMMQEIPEVKSVESV